MHKIIIALTAVTLYVLAAAVVVLSAPTQARATTTFLCPNGAVCFFQNSNWTGATRTYQLDSGGTGYWRGVPVFGSSYAGSVSNWHNDLWVDSTSYGNYQCLQEGQRIALNGVYNRWWDTTNYQGCWEPKPPGAKLAAIEHLTGGS